MSAGRYKPYMAYKDSRVEWLGEIPAHWGVRRLRSTLTSCQNGVWGNEPGGVHDIVCVRVADFNRVAFRVDVNEPTMRSIDPAVVVARGLRSGDLLIEKSGGGEKQPVGAVVIFDHQISAVCSNFVARVTIAAGHDPRYQTYVHAALYGQRINTRHIKQSTGIQNLDSSGYLSETIGLPPEPEQRAIAAFLDRETARIDGLVAKKERLIELLREQRTALITRAVTKGLDSNVPMKDSGVEWLGEIPAHWEIRRLTTVCSFESGKAHEPFVDEAGEYVCVNSRFVSTNGKTKKFCTQNLSPARQSDVLMVMSDLPNGRALARTFFVREDRLYAVNQRVCAISAKACSPRFMFYFLDRNPHFLRYDDGVNQTHLPNAAFTKCPVLLPPLPEQAEIAAFLDAETARFDGLGAKVREAIDRLREFRTALISATVTGKIDVREEVA